MTQSAAGLSILSNTVEIGGSNVGAFGDLIAVGHTPVVQMDFVYGINVQTGLATTANSATVDTNASRLRLQSGVNAAGSGIFNSRRTAKYRAGQGMTARFTAAFTAGVANSTQIVGVGNAVDGYFFGFNGTAFGILHLNNSTPSWTAQTAWNGDKCDGTGPTGFTLNKTFGNVYQIIYPYLGYGAIRFYVQDSVSGSWLLAHTIQYPNTTVSTQLTNPNLFFYAQSLNTGATTNQIVYVGSVGFFISGVRSFIGNPKWSYTANSTTVTTEVVAVNLRNATTYNGVTNRSSIRLHSVGVSSTANNGTVTVRFYVAATIAGSPSWTTINGTTGDAGVTITAGNSVASKDTAGTTSGGLMVYSAVVASPASSIIDLVDNEIFLSPAEILSITVASTSSTTVGLALNWTEDQ